MEQLKGKRVLVVEDESLVAMALDSVLVTLGCQVVGPLCRLDEALAAAIAEDFDLAILDVNLAGQPVFPVAEILAGRRVPFAFATGYDEQERIPTDLRNRPRLQKPFDLKGLEQTLLGMANG